MNFKDLKEKTLKIFHKLRYVIEFILMILTTITLYQVITVKAYEHSWDWLEIVFLAITGISTLLVMIYNCKKDKDKIENMFLNFAIPVGLLFIMFMLPTYTPDAASHAWKSYEVSNGIFFTTINDKGKAITEVPKVMSVYRETVLTDYATMNEVLQSEDSNNYDNTVEVDCPSKGYCFIYYIGYAIGMFIAKILQLNIFIGLYLARIINFIIVLGLGYIAIKKMPFGKILLCVYLMIPMFMQQATAFSADSIMNSTIILFIAYCLNLIFKQDPINKKEKIIFLILTIFIGISKVPYFPFIGLGLILAKRRKEMTKKEIILLGFATLVVCVGSFFILSRLNSGYTNGTAQKYLEQTGVNSGEQLKGILTNPFHFVKVLVNNLFVNGEYYLTSAIGNHMGWLSITVPRIFVILYIALLITSAFAEENKEVFRKLEKLWIVFLAIIMCILIVLGLYLEWTKVGVYQVAGVQGRYFLPIGILFLLALCTKHNHIKVKNTNVIMPLCALLINLLFIGRVILFFI